MTKKTKKPNDTQSDKGHMLDDYDCNFNSGQSTEVQKEYSMDLPSILTYKDLNAHSVVSKLMSSAVDCYLAAFDKMLEKNLCGSVQGWVH